MGEIIFSLFVGGWMILMGIVMNWWLTKEQKRVEKKEAKGGV
jgi:hypothetical protein